MIVTLFLYLISYFFALIAFVLPSWNIWPSTLLDGLRYVSASFAKFNFILPIQDTGGWADALTFFIHFSAAYVSLKILLKVIGFARGSGQGLDIK